MASSEGAADTPGSGKKVAKDEPKAKRVRTGCLTCRERHLKCDEGKPECHNCVKSNRPCNRGVRLNFIDTRIERPPILVGTANEWQVAFCDESRDIASEYKGGREKYANLDADTAMTVDDANFFMDLSQHIPGNMHQNTSSHTTNHNTNHMSNDLSSDMSGMSHGVPSQPAPLPPITGMLPDSYQEESRSLTYEQPHQHVAHSQHSHSHSKSSYTGSNHPSYSAPERSLSPPEPEPRDYLDTQEEVLFMQVFVEEVGLWMDSMDPQKHFSRLLPFHALGEPMLLNAFLACGARHLALVNPNYNEDKALHYYDTATRHLLDSLQNPNRDTVICATTAVILNVYEIMCERALQRMNHIAGARALIKECGWSARSTGIGAACFWLNVGMELLSCLHFNWQVAWDPDDWGLDMDFSRETDNGREEIWTYRIVYIVAKVANFRATIPRNNGDLSSPGDQMRLQARYKEWQHLKSLADRWNDNIPRTMHPIAYLQPGQALSGSAFPEVWLIKRTSVVARLFYHTAMCLLAQINPLQGPDGPEMSELLQRHSQLICGISAHVKDRGVASVALRSLAIAAEVLTARVEQEEVLSIFQKIRQETGWRVGFLNDELKAKWGWDKEPQPNGQNFAPNGNIAYQQQQQQQQQQHQQQQQQHQHQLQNQQHQQQQQQMSMQLQAPPPTSLPPPPPAPSRKPPQGILNPMYNNADFNMPSHPYQSYYVAPNPNYHPSDPTQHPLAGYYMSGAPPH